MKRKSSLCPEFGYSSNLYFPKALHPCVLKIGQKKLFNQMRYESHLGTVEYIFVRSGHGVLCVNGENFQIQSGDASVFMSHHFHKFTPLSDEPLVLDYFQITTGTYIYMLANPYQRDDTLTSLLEDMNKYELLHFSDIDSLNIQEKYDQMRNQYTAHPNNLKLCIFQAMELIGHYNRCANNPKKSTENPL